MLRRTLLIAGIGLLPVLDKPVKSKASEALAAVPKATVFELNGSTKARLEAVLVKNGYRLTGELRRRGELISTVAERNGASWKLVLDGQSGEIVGRRLIATPVNEKT